MKKTLKKIFDKFGLLPLVDWLIRVFSIHNAAMCWNGFKFYIFNHWVSNFPNYRLRIFYLKHVLGIRIGKECFIHMGCFFEGKNVDIGDNTVIGRNCYLGGSGGKLTIKNNVSITAQTYIFCSTHITDDPDFKCINKDVVIEDYAWIGARAMIFPGVRIGKGAILGATSTATKDIPDHCIYVGIPASEIRKRNNDLRYRLKYFPYFQ